MITGILYGIGVGPGDPELMTLKAIHTIEQCDVLAVPQTKGSRTVALDIVKQTMDISDKNLLPLKIPMSRDKQVIKQNRDEIAKLVIEQLKLGKSVAFLTLGDPTIYSTYLYTHRRVLKQGFSAQIIPGVPSFCAVAARLNDSLVENEQPLHIIPASYDGVEEALNLTGTKVLMKAGKSVEEIKTLLKQNNCYQMTKMVQNCGMKDEKVIVNLDEVDNQASYFSIFVVKDGTEELIEKESEQ